MNIAYDVVAHITQDPLDTLPDHRWAQMSNMKRFGHIRAAVIDQNLFRFLCALQSELFFRHHPARHLDKQAAAHRNINKSRSHGLYLLKR